MLADSIIMAAVLGYCVFLLLRRRKQRAQGCSGCAGCSGCGCSCGCGTHAGRD